LLASNLSAAENKALELDGFGSYVELPPNIFTNLTEGKLVGNARAVTADSPADAPLAAAEPLKATQQLPPPALPATGPANVLANNQNPAMWCIVGALTLIVALLTWLVLMLRRSGVGEYRLLPPSPARALLMEGHSALAAVEARN